MTPEKLEEIRRREAEAWEVASETLATYNAATTEVTALQHRIEGVQILRAKIDEVLRKLPRIDETATLLINVGQLVRVELEGRRAAALEELAKIEPVHAAAIQVWSPLYWDRRFAEERAAMEGAKP